MKIDVEGHEPAVLKGAAHTITSGAQFLTEIIRDKIAAEISDQLCPARYQYHFIDEQTGKLNDVTSRLTDGKPVPLGNYQIQATPR